MVRDYLDNLSYVLKHPPPVKKNWIEVREKMIVHTRGVLPKKLLDVVRPSESIEIKQYRLDTYEPITKDAINHGIDAVLRAFISSNFKIEYSDTTGEYVTENKFTLLDEQYFNEPLSLLQFIIEHIGRFDFDDPNGYLLWLPVHPDDPKKLPSELDPSKAVKIQPLLVDSYNILDVTEEVLTFQTDEKKKIKIDKDYYKEAPYIFVVSKYAIYRFNPYWDKEIKYKEELWYNMGLEDDDNNPVNDDLAFPFIPAKVLGGNICMNSANQIFFESFFQSYAAFGNKAIHAISDNDGVRVRYNFPFSSIKEDECPKCKGSGRCPSEHAEDKGRLMKCSGCKGKGTIAAFTPYGTHIKKPPASGQSEAYSLSPAVEFYNADVAILDSSFNTWQRFLELAKESINLVFTHEAQSGVAKEYDREEKMDMLFKICNNLFDLLKFSMDCIECYLVRLKSDRELEKNVVRNPTTFAIKTQDDLFTELKDMIEKNVPQPFIIQSANELATKVYNGDLVMQKAIQVLTIWDTLFGAKQDAISTLKAIGAITNKETYIHQYGLQVLLQLSQDKGFVDDTIENIIKKADAKISPLIPQPEPLMVEMKDDESGETT